MNFAKPPLTEHQKQAVEALEELHGICTRHDIHFFLIAGTCLGAVRHKGFIPWDDDIDVGLRLADWQKLRAILPAELDAKFQYVDDKVSAKWPRLFGRILYQGRSCIDVFQIVRWPAGYLRGMLHWQLKQFAVQAYRMANKLDLSHKRMPGISYLRYCVTLFNWQVRGLAYYLTHGLFSLNGDDYRRLHEWNQRYFEDRDTGWYVTLYGRHPMRREMFKAEWIDHPSTVEFEGRLYETVGDTDAFLKHLYGDYMRMPPEKEKVNSHTHIIKL